MTENEFVFCCTIFCKHFEGRKFGDVVKKCYECDSKLLINVINNIYIVEKFNSRMRIGNNMVFWFENGILEVVIGSHDITFETVNNFLEYFKIPFEDIV